MEEERNKSFDRDQDIAELMKLLQHFRDNDGLAKLNHTVEYVDDLEKTLSMMTEQLADMKSILQNVRGQNDYLMTRAERTVKDVLVGQVAKVEEKVHELHKKLVEIKDSIKQKAHEIVEEAKYKGRKALKKMSDMLHIRDGLVKIREHADQMLGTLDELSGRIDGYKEQADRQSHLRPPEERGSVEADNAKNVQQVGTYQEEMQNFIRSCVADGREYGSNAEAFEEFKQYYAQRMKDVDKMKSAVGEVMSRHMDDRIR